MSNSIEEVDTIKAHYTKTLLEPIELMMINFSTSELKGFIKGNIVKYSMRANFKGQLESDKKKLDWYIQLFKYLEQSDWDDLLYNYRDFKEAYIYIEDRHSV